MGSVELFFRILLVFFSIGLELKKSKLMLLFYRILEKELTKINKFLMSLCTDCFKALITLIWMWVLDNHSKIKKARVRSYNLMSQNLNLQAMRIGNPAEIFVKVL